MEKLTKNMGDQSTDFELIWGPLLTVIRGIPLSVMPSLSKIYEFGHLLDLKRK